MRTDRLDALYTTLAEALGRVGEERTSLLLATLSLEWLSSCAEDDARSRFAMAAIERAERLARA